MKELKQIGWIHFYPSENSDTIFSIITDICKGLESYVSGIRCESNYGEIEFKYSFGAEHYSIKCGFNKHHMLLMDRYQPLENFKHPTLLDAPEYILAIHEEQQIFILHNKVLSNIKLAFLKTNSKK